RQRQMCIRDSIQTLWSGLFPICIYFLFKLIDETNIKNLSMLILTIVFQSLMNMYYIVYLALILPLVGIPYVIWNKKITDIKLCIFLIIAAISSSMILMPFTLPYLELRDSFGLVRDIKTIASLPDLKNLMGITRFNLLYKEYLSILDINEGSFFLGISVSTLAIFGILLVNLKRVYYLIMILILIFSFLVISGPNPVIKFKDMTFNYGFLYRFLYEYFPAFDGTRVPMRFYIFTIISVSIFTGSTIALIQNRQVKILKISLTIILFVLVAIEYYSKIPIIKYPIYSNPPEILKTLNNKAKGAVIFFPLREAYSHILYSSIINKPTYTPFTGYIHFLNPIMKEIENNPEKMDTLRILSAMGIKYIVLTDRSLAEKFDKIHNTGDITISKIYDHRDGLIYSLNYEFTGYFAYTDFKDLDISIKNDKYSLYLKADIGSNKIKVPLRLYFNVIVRYKKGDRIIKSEKIKIKVPEIIRETKIFLIEGERNLFNFDELEVLIYEKDKNRGIKLNKKFSS
ncbi:MAG: hypothetical protein N2746_10820, partial [Deltaproteobacteria bacterium]|nr:hypothetical protein [Deltaproteobacteria bacterium]